MGITQINFDYKQKTEVAIELIQEHEPPEGYYVAFSGGKDSTVILNLVKQAGVNYDAHYCVSPIDPPQLHQHIKEHFPEVRWDYHARGFWKMVTAKDLPMRQSRWCCEYIKEAGGNNRVIVLGNRKEEGKIRKEQKEYGAGYGKARNKTFIRPILNWLEGEVWEYIYANGLPFCDLYDVFSRLGCVLCPFSRAVKLEMMYFPKIVNLWRLACGHIVEKWQSNGTQGKHTNKTGEELFNWWVSRK